MEIGKFGWHDLATDDVERAAAFYAATFDWECRAAQANGGVYHRLSAAGRDMASLYRIGDRAQARGLRPHWTSYVAVSSVAETVARATRAGGAVLVRPFEVVETGARIVARIALVADPDGATLGLWEAVAPTP